MKVPFMDLGRASRSRGIMYVSSMNDVLNSGGFILGNEVKKLEEGVEKYLGLVGKKVFGVSSGTSAIKIALQILDLNEDDEVLIPANTTSFCTIPIIELGLKVVPVDVNDTYLMDVDRLEEKITEKTKVIMPIHLYGRACDMDKINEIAKRNNLFVLEDCSQSFGATYKGKKVGNFGDVSAISLYPTKNLSGLGDGGLVIVNDGDAEKLSKIRHGDMVGRDVFSENLSCHSRMDDIFAACVNVNLRFVDEDNQKRKEFAKLYCEGLKGVGDLVLPEDIEGHVYHLFVVRTKRRDELKKYLEEKGVGTGIHYPIPLHKQPYANKYGLGDYTLINSENFCNEILSLPMYSELTKGEVEVVIEKIKAFFK